MRYEISHIGCPQGGDESPKLVLVSASLTQPVMSGVRLEFHLISRKTSSSRFFPQFWLSSSKVERQSEELRVAGASPA